MLEVLAILSPLLGGFFGLLMSDSPKRSHFLQGFFLSFLTMLLLMDWIPSGFHHSGVWGIATVIIGYVFAGRIELTKMEDAIQGVSLDSLWLVALVLVHVFSDGVLIGTASHHSDSVVFGLALHRVLFGVSLVGALSLLKSSRLLWPALGAAVVITYFGFLFGDALMSGQSGHILSGHVSLFIAGGLVHVILHLWETVTSEHDVQYFAAHSPSSAGAAVGFVLSTVVLVQFGHQHDGMTSAADSFWEYMSVSAPALLMAYGIAGLLTTGFFQKAQGWLSRGNAYSQSLKGIAIGLPLPVCSCGVVPLYQSLIKNKVPLAASLAFLIATPEIGVEAFLLSFPLLGTELTVIRLVAAAVFALSVPLLLVLIGGDRLITRDSDDGLEGQSCCHTKKADTPPSDHQHAHHDGHSHGHAEHQRKNFITRVRDGYFEQAIDTLPWVLVGLMLASWIPEHALAPIFDGMWPGAQVILGAAVGVPLYICASGATPLIASLLVAGLSPGAGLTMLLLGPATNVTTFGVLNRLHGERFAKWFMLTATIIAILIGLSVNQFVTDHWSAPHTHAHGQSGWLGLISGSLLVMLFAANIYQHGLKAFMNILRVKRGA